MSIHFRGIGVMTGTSMDGFDLVYADFSQVEGEWNYEILHTQTVPISIEWKSRLSALPEANAETFARTNIELSHYFGLTIREFIKSNEIQPQFVAIHGQTIFHQPESGFTCQIVDGETVVTYLDCLLVSNFRNKDVALGGQGAPLVPFGELNLFEEYDFCLNLGGFANLSIGDTAFDICACNLVLNQLVKGVDNSLEYDQNGAIARSGNMIPALYNQLNELQYYILDPPKSLGIEWLESAIIPVLDVFNTKPPADCLHTYVAHIAYQVCKALNDHSSGEGRLLITGGGAFNSFLVDSIVSELKSLKVEVLATDEILIEYKEALIFAFLGLQTLLGNPNTVPGVTGAKSAAVSGSVHIPVDGGYRLL